MLNNKRQKRNAKKQRSATEFRISAWLIAFLKWLYDFSGLHFIIRKAFPFKKEEERKLPTITIWILVIYFATFGIASQKHENKVDRLEIKTNLLMAQTATGAFKSAIGRLSGIQREKVPVKPELSSPLSIVKSLFGADVVHDDTIELLKDIVVSLKADRLNDPKDLSKVGLFEANLHGADLSGADLSGAKLDEANLGDANLSNTNLGEAKLNGANLSGAVLVGAFLTEADLSGAKLIGANLSEAVLHEAILSKAFLLNTDFTNSKYTDSAKFASRKALNSELRLLIPNGKMTEEIWSRWKATYKKHNVAYPKEWDSGLYED